MANPDPKQEIINKLTRLLLPRANATPESTEGQRTLRFLKERCIAGRQVHFVMFEDAKGQNMHFTCYVVQDAQGNWQFRGAAGDSITGTPGPVVEQGWANLGGGGMPDHFYAGGYVADHGLDVTRVRLVAKNGTVIEDTVENDIVLFLTDQLVTLPIEAEIYNRSGKLVYKHRVLG
ncbi:MAG: hypothetical protein NVS2B12_31730 [Ktedonobacteraceae bacterium]